MDSRNCQTPTASPAEPGGLPLTLGIISFSGSYFRRGMHGLTRLIFLNLYCPLGSSR